jgi:anthocyanidin reductase
VFVAEEAAAGRYICCSIKTTVIDIARFLPDQYTVRTELM